jgi:hypothetical protein
MGTIKCPKDSTIEDGITYDIATRSKFVGIGGTSGNM